MRLPIPSSLSSLAFGRTTLAFAQERPAPATTRYTTALLDSARRRTDPLADDAIAAIAAAGKIVGPPAVAIRRHAARGDVACKALLARAGDVPAWVDFDRMRGGHEFALRHVLPGGYALLAGSLLESYAAAGAAKVLVGTGRLIHDTRKRLARTTRFVSDLAVSRGARPGTPVFDDVLGVRLMHAWARRHVAGKPGWDPADGVPVSQEDLLLTLMHFSHVFRRGLETLGLRMSAREHDALHHSWRYTGFLLGIEEPLLPTSCAEEEELYLATTARLYVPSDAGRALTKALLDTTVWHPPFFTPRPVLVAIARRLVGPALADVLGVPAGPVFDVSMAGFAGVQGATQQALDAASWTRDWRVRLGERTLWMIDQAGKF